MGCLGLYTVPYLHRVTMYRDGKQMDTLAGVLRGVRLRMTGIYFFMLKS